MTALSHFLKTNKSGADDSSPQNNKCFYEFDEYLTNRFILIGVITTVVCMIGIAGNFSIIVTMAKRRVLSVSNYFIIALATVESLVLLFTVLLYSFEVLFEYTENVDMYYFYFTYARTGYVASHVSQIFAVYITLAASCERCVSLYDRTTNIANLFRPSRVPAILAGLLLLTVAMTLSKYWEIDVQVNESCPGFGRFKIIEGPLLNNTAYVDIYVVVLANILFIFLPFVTLAALNAFIWQKLRRLTRVLGECIQLTTSFLIRRAKRSKRRNREETVVLFVVVVVFLVCNLPQVLLTATERIDRDFLDRNRKFYSLARDSINLLTCINSSSNFIICVIFGRQFRKSLRVCRQRKESMLPYTYDGMFEVAERSALEARLSNINGQSEISSVPIPKN